MGQNIRSLGTIYHEGSLLELINLSDILHRLQRHFYLKFIDKSVFL